MTARREPSRCPPITPPGSPGRAGMNNLATGMQYIGLLAMVEDQIVDCFRHGGGVPYSAFPRFQAVMAEDSGAVHDATLIDVTLPLVPGLVDRLREGIDVADVGCGSGHAVNLMAGAFPRSRFTGFDFSDAGIAAARAEADRKRLTNARFEKRDAAQPRRDGPVRLHHHLRLGTRPGPAGPDAGRDSRRPCAPTGFTSASTPPPPASSRRTWTTRSDRSCTPSRACTA